MAMSRFVACAASRPFFSGTAAEAAAAPGHGENCGSGEFTQEKWRCSKHLKWFVDKENGEAKRDDLTKDVFKTHR